MATEVVTAENDGPHESNEKSQAPIFRKSLFPTSALRAFVMTHDVSNRGDLC